MIRIKQLKRYEAIEKALREETKNITNELSKFITTLEINYEKLIMKI